jgi:uncharacterized protein (TIGR03067 family)
MRHQIFMAVGIVCGFALSAAGAQNPEVNKELHKLDGSWQMETLQQNGDPTPAEEVKKLRLVLRSHHWTMMSEDKPVASGNYTVDPAKKTIDRVDIEGKDAGKKFRGIYQLDGDSLKTSWAPATEDRPTNFEYKKGSNRELNILKRIKTDPTAAKQHKSNGQVARKAKTATHG